MSFPNTSLTWDNSTWKGISDDNSTDWDIGGDEVTKETYYNIILWAPFVAIPALILLVRSLQYFYNFLKLKKAGKNLAELGLDPWSELGLLITQNEAKIRQIDRIRKEQERVKKLQKEDVEDEDSAPRTFLTQISKKTSKTITEKLSPEAVRKFFGATKWGRTWMILQVIFTVASILNYIVLTYSITRHDKKFVKRLDVALAVLFLSDYLISLYTAEDRLRFYFKPSSLTDLLSIIPPFVYVLVSDTSPYVWFLGLLRILRASRVLRTYRLISFSETEERRELTILGISFLNFLFLSASIINALETLEGNRKDPPTLQTWHDSLYYIMVTFSTIGFGDLTPGTIPSRIVVMILIILVVVFVPLQTSKLSELYNSTNAYQRANFKPVPRKNHVIVSGSINHAGIIDFCREYFANDVMGHIVILAADVPTLEVRRILRHPYYRTRVHYLCGSPLSLQDMKRSAASTATGLFLLNAKTSSVAVDEDFMVTRGADSEILMQALTSKSYFPSLPIFSQLQDIRSQDLSAHCGCDRSICLDDVKTSITARACLIPGLLPLLMNLILTFSDDHDVDLNKEYTDGAANRLHSFKVPSAFVGQTFGNTFLALYRAFGFTIFGIVKDGKIRLGPEPMRVFEQDDVVICIGVGGDELILRICIHFSDSRVITPELGSLEARRSTNTVEKGGHEDVLITSALEENECVNVSNAKDQSSCTESNFERHIIVTGNLTARGIRNFIKTIRKSSSTMPIVCLLESIPTSTNEGIWSDIVSDPHVHLLKGTPLKKTNLKKAGIARCKSIVIFAKAEADIPDAASIFIIQMIKQDWPDISFIVELLDASNTKYLSHMSTCETLRVQSLLNNYSLTIEDRISSYQQAQSQNSDTFSLFEHVRKFISSSSSSPSSSSEYQPIQATSLLNPVPYHVSPVYIRGNIFTCTFTHAFLVQSYFRPYVVDVLGELGGRMDVVSGKSGKYIDIVIGMLRIGYVVFGMFRRSKRGAYVYTNCHPTDLVTESDLIYFI